MFSKSFYPTPDKLIQKMIAPYVEKNLDYFKKRMEEHDVRYNYLDKVKSSTFSDMTILEPSAGKGNICDYLTENFNKLTLKTCEIDPELKYILQGKGYAVIADDFLEYEGDYFFDLVVMNPPFEHGAKHLLKAWDILEQGNIVCLLNAETIKNPYTQERQLLLSIIDEHGRYELSKDEFIQAEHKSSVEIAIVWLEKSCDQQSLNFEFSDNGFDRTKSASLSDDTFKDKVATNDIIQNMMIQYDTLKTHFKEFLRVHDALRFYSDGLLGEYDNIIELAKGSLCKDNNNKSFNNFCDKIKSQLWKKVLSKTNVDKYMTSSVQKNFNEFLGQQASMEFNKDNVAKIIDMIFNNRFNIMESAVIDVFDHFTKYHKDNRVYVEGWKTNDKWKVNEKVILPNAVKYGSYMNAYDLRKYGDKFSIDWNRKNQFHDIDRVMCYLSGIPFESCFTIESALTHHIDRLGNVAAGSFDNETTSTFFDIKFFKKGTLHISFKDKLLWQEFNLRACAGKQWLPENEQKKYEDSRQQHAHSPFTSTGLLCAN
ncbi:MAG: DUF4942 domain-containing protein [Bacteroidota bacterium]